MMYIDNEVLEKMIMTIVEGFDRIEKKLDRMGRVKEFLNGDEHPTVSKVFSQDYLSKVSTVV
jgi:hypothetical protein